MANGKKKQRLLIWIGTVCIALVFLGGGFMVVKMLLSKDEGKRRRQIQSVTLVKPPPPPKIKEKPPEPEVKKEEIIEPEPEETPPDEAEDTSDEPPPGQDLGLDADGTAGADGFGLKAKKGGRALIGGGGGGSLMRYYAWYLAILQDELRGHVNELLSNNGGIPEGNLNVYVRLTLDDSGRVTNYELYKSSGDSRMDEAVQEALKVAIISEPPPEGMPRTMKLQISAKG